MAVVLDVSATLSWLLDDERDGRAVAMAQTVLDAGAVVPGVWRLELRNALLTAQRRGRLTPEAVVEMLADVRFLPIEIVPEPPGPLEPEITLARTHRLSVYDAAYLELAVRLGAALMSRDDALNAAAERVGLRWRYSKKRSGRQRSPQS